MRAFVPEAHASGYSLAGPSGLFPLALTKSSVCSDSHSRRIKGFVTFVQFVDFGPRTTYFLRIQRLWDIRDIRDIRVIRGLRTSHYALRTPRYAPHAHELPWSLSFWGFGTCLELDCL